MLKAQVIGNLGGDPEMRYSANGVALLSFSVASNYRQRTQDGEWQDRVEWVRCTIFGKRAESLNDILRKGMRVFVDGNLTARPWTDQQGGIRAGIEIAANDVEFFSPRQDGDAQRQPVGASTGRAQVDDSDLPF